MYVIFTRFSICSGCHVYSISRPESPFLALALAAGKRISLFYWEESSIWYQKENSKIPDAPPARFASEKVSTYILL